MIPARQLAGKGKMFFNQAAAKSHSRQGDRRPQGMIGKANRISKGLFQHANITQMDISIIRWIDGNAVQ